ncbi:hypothetical protein NM688_g3654 [Phlebia brevispora]|uniref:Uncharacterized protein n=1 Tax=Phlebia brevispora TaxID=194682 RepID=A0ACC1T5D3_9APHY|nr:hypothetical protein NM688_g3654 [Phlebia brevispora]
MNLAFNRIADGPTSYTPSTLATAGRKRRDQHFGDRLVLGIRDGVASRNCIFPVVVSDNHIALYRAVPVSTTRCLQADSQKLSFNTSEKDLPAQIMIFPAIKSAGFVTNSLKLAWMETTDLVADGGQRHEESPPLAPVQTQIDRQKTSFDWLAGSGQVHAWK